MAHVAYRVSGRPKDSQTEVGERVRTVTRRFPDTREGRREKNQFMATLADPTTRYEVRYRVDGREVSKTFKHRKPADDHVTKLDNAEIDGLVADPRRARQTLTTYARAWLARHDVAESTKALYEHLLEKHILPALGDTSLGKLNREQIEAWHSALKKSHPTTGAKAYRLLAGIMTSAVNSDPPIIPRTPCRIQGAAKESAPERPVASVAEVGALAEAMPENMRIAVLLAAWCQLRRGELLGLRRRDVDLLHGTIRVAVTTVKTMAGTFVSKQPKTEAGIRTVHVPPHIMPVLEQHLERFVEADKNSLVLPGGYRPLRTAWDNARKVVGVEYHLHDLRHAGLTWTAAKGATVAELMHRAGHKSPKAAMTYQHATKDRDKALANALADLAQPAKVVKLQASRDSRGIPPAKAARRRPVKSTKT